MKKNKIVSTLLLSAACFCMGSMNSPVMAGDEDGSPEVQGEARRLAAERFARAISMEDASPAREAAAREEAAREEAAALAEAAREEAAAREEVARAEAAAREEVAREEAELARRKAEHYDSRFEMMDEWIDPRQARHDALQRAQEEAERREHSDWGDERRDRLADKWENDKRRLEQKKWDNERFQRYSAMERRLHEENVQRRKAGSHGLSARLAAHEERELEAKYKSMAQDLEGLNAAIEKPGLDRAEKKELRGKITALEQAFNKAGVSPSTFLQARPATTIDTSESAVVQIRPTVNNKSSDSRAQAFDEAEAREADERNNEYERFVDAGESLELAKRAAAARAHLADHEADDAMNVHRDAADRAAAAKTIQKNFRSALKNRQAEDRAEVAKATKPKDNSYEAKKARAIARGF